MSTGETYTYSYLAIWFTVTMQSIEIQ